MKKLRDRFWHGMDRGGLPHLLKLWYGGFATVLNFPHDPDATRIDAGQIVLSLRYFTERGYLVVSLDELVRRLQAKEVDQKVVTLTFDDSYPDTLSLARPTLAEFGYPFTLYVRTGQPSLSWAEVRQLAKDPAITIGAHGLSDQPLSRLSDEEALREMLESKNRLEAEIGKMVRHFAYPVGNRAAAGRREFRLAEEVGFLTAVTTRRGNVHPGHRKHLTSLPRVSVKAGPQSERALAHDVSGFGAFRMRQFNRLVTE